MQIKVPHPLYLQGLWHFFNLSTVKDEIIILGLESARQAVASLKKGRRIEELEQFAREFDTLKSKKVPQSLEIGLFFCQIFIFII